MANHMEAVRILLEFDANPTLQDDFEITPLTMATRHGDNDGMFDILTNAAVEYVERRHDEWLNAKTMEL